MIFYSVQISIMYILHVLFNQAPSYSLRPPVIDYHVYHNITSSDESLVLITWHTSHSLVCTENFKCKCWKFFFSQVMLIKRLIAETNFKLILLIDVWLMAKQGLLCCVLVLTLTKCKDLNNIMYDYKCLESHIDGLEKSGEFFNLI